MRTLVATALLILVVQSSSAQALWRNYWTTNQNPQITPSLVATNAAASNQVLTATSAGTAAWKDATGSTYNPKSVFVGFDDFNWGLTSATTPNGPLALARSSAGAAAGITFVSIFTNTVGVASFASGTSANVDFAALSARGFNISDNNINLTNEVRFNLNNYVPTVDDGSLFRFGIASVTSWSWLPANGAYIRYSTNSANFEYVTTKATSTTITDSGIAPNINTWYTGKIVFLGTQSILFSINNGIVTSVTLNMPTNTAMSHIIQMMKAGGATSQTVDVDYDLISYGIIPSR